MNREIKFRAWDKNEGMIFDITSFECVNGKIDGIFYDGDYIGQVSEDLVLMQFTGLTDKNGVDIYESDIVKCNGYKTEIKWSKSTGYMIQRGHDRIMGYKYYAALGAKAKVCEVIGNIHEEVSND